MSAVPIRRHTLILQRLHKGPATQGEILHYIELRTEADHDTLKPSARTFRRDKMAILEYYGIDIMYRATDKCYYLPEDDDPQLGDRILEAYNIGNMLKLPEALNGQILFEKRRPRGMEYIDRLLQAIRQHLMVRFTYQSFADPAVTDRTVYPYALKEFKGRWYLLASESKDGLIKSFGLDRMANLESTKRSFSLPKDFNPEQKYRDCFGITGPNSEGPANIILSFDPVAGRYVKTFPLHHSQDVLIDDEEEVRISLHLYITRDFIMEILSHGADLKVIAPTTLKTTLKQELQRALSAMED